MVRWKVRPSPLSYLSLTGVVEVRLPKPSAGRPGCRGVRATGLRRGLGDFALGLLRGALLFQLRQVEEILPAEQHEAGQNEGEDGIGVLGHASGLFIQCGWGRA